MNSQQQHAHSTKNSSAQHLHQQQNNNNGQQFIHTNNSQQSDRNSNSASWSVVTTGGSPQSDIGQPPIYQNQQFQNEFPSLDGTIHSGLTKTHQVQQQGNAAVAHTQSNHHQDGGNQSNSDTMSLRPHTEPGSWHQQQQQAGAFVGGKGNGGEGNNSGNSQNAPQGPALQVPPELKAVMPSFMMRSGGGPNSQMGQQTGGFGSHTPSSGNNFQNQMQQQHQQQQNYSQQSQNQRSRSQYGNDHPSAYQGRRSGNIPPRLQSQQQSQRYEPAPLIEPDTIIHRPIIRDEELERIENIAKDDGWAKDDAMDYNQKLNFSDDEIDPPLVESTLKAIKIIAKNPDLQTDNKKKVMDDDSKSTSKF